MNNYLSLALAGIDASFHEPYASLMKGLVYGVPIVIDPTLKKEIVGSGLAHLVVLSGANVTLLTQFSETLFFSLHKKIGILLQVIFLGGFVLLVGPQAPLMRAVGMFVCTALCILSGRLSYGLWNLFLTILAVAILHPQWVTSLSFQLSVGATIGVMIWTTIASQLKKPLSGIVETFFESWVVFLVTLPLTAIAFGKISLMSPFSTALVSWLVVPLMVAGFIISLLHLFYPPLALLAAIPTQLGLSFIISVIQYTSHIPYGTIQLK